MPHPHLMHRALSQVAGLRGLILRSQLIVLLKHKVGDAAWQPWELCLSPGAPVLPVLLNRSWWMVPVTNLSSPEERVGASILCWGYPNIFLHPTGLTSP